MKKFLLILVCSIVFSTMLLSQGYSLQFNGVNNYVDCLSGGIGNNPSVITQEAWVKTNIVEAGPIMTKRHADDGSDWASLIVSTGKLRIYADDKATPNTDTPAPTTITDGKWHHVAGVRNNNTYIVYVDGVLDMTSTDNHVMGGSPYNLHIGHLGAWNGYFNGQIAEVRVWNRALSEAEIKSKMFSNLVPAQETGLVGYWKFDEGTGTAATDLAGTNNGTIHGATWVSDRPSITNFGLVAYYPFNGNANDESGNGQNGTVNGATLTTDRFGNTGKAYSFNGISNSITIDTSFFNLGANEFSISGWSYLNTLNNYNNGAWDHSLIGTYPDLGFGFAQNWGATKKYCLFLSNGSGWDVMHPFSGGTSKQEVSVGVWKFFTLIKNGLNYLVYVDGKLDTTIHTSIAMNQRFQKINLSNSSEPIDGKLDDFRIYNRAINESEIQALYHEGGYPTLTTGLVAYYPFSGNTNDSSGSGNNGVPQNGVALTTDRFGNTNKAYNFDGLDDFIEVPNSSSLQLTNSQFTLSAWATHSRIDNADKLILCKSDGGGNTAKWTMMYSCGLNTPAGIGMHVNPASPTTSVYNNQPQLNKWYHYIIVRKDTLLNIYVDGTLVKSSTWKFTIPATVGNLRIGGQEVNGGGEWFSGKLDDIRIYNRVLSDTEIQSLYTEGMNVDTTTTWQMQLKASVSSYLDNENYLGVSDNATELQDAVFDTPEPPAPAGNYVTLYFPHAEWSSILGNNFANDIKKTTALADTVKRWYFQVKSNVISDSVTLSFVNDRIPSSFGKYLTDLKTGKRVNLKTTSSYKYYNTSDTARSFLLIVGDSTAPQLTLTSPNGSNIWRSGTSKNIAWSVSDGTGIDSIFIYSSSNAGTAYSLLKSLSYAQSTSWTVPAEYLNNNYSVKVIGRDSVGNQSTVKSAKTFTIVGDSLATSNAAGWSMVSVPITPKDSAVSSMFDNTSYLWSYTQLTGYTQPSKITLGNGYWLGVTTTKNWSVKGIANETDSSVQTLQLGYNIIGNNFVRNVSKNNLYFLKSGSYYSFSTAVTAGLISNALYGYSSSAYSSVDTMSLFRGYWIGVLQSGVQLIQKPNVSIVTPLAKQSQIMATNWELPIKVSTVSLADDIAMIGIKQNSSSGFDAQFDAPRPPRNPGSNYLEMYFTNTGGNYPAVLGSKYAKDFRDSSSAIWNFTIENSQNNDVTLSWNKTLLEGLAGSLQLNLRDNFNNAVVDMKQAGSYTFAYTTPRIFSINAKITKVGKNGETLPTEFSLSQNYPNPFNPTTTLRYGVPERSTVRLSVYNTLGQLVSQVYSGTKDAGFYGYSFDASRLSSGIYLYKIEAVSQQNPSKTFVQTKKMVLMR